MDAKVTRNVVVPEPTKVMVGPETVATLTSLEDHEATAPDVAVAEGSAGADWPKVALKGAELIVMTGVALAIVKEPAA